MKNKNSDYIPFSPPDIREADINEVVEALKSGWITTGKRTKQFENDISAFVGTNKAVCLNSCTAALELILRILDIKEGDEVITTAYTYTASAAVINHVGAKIVLVDTQEDSCFMNYDMVEKAITEKTKAIIAVDVAGIPCDYDRIFEIVKSKSDIFNPSNKIQKSIGRIAVIADAAHSLGAVYKNFPVGNIADFTAFSFHAVKNLTTAEGGAIVWKSAPYFDDDYLYKQFMLYSLHGQNKDAFSKTQFNSWEYDIIYPAYKCNMTDILAAVGIKQLERYGEILERRKAIIEKYDNAFKGICEVLPHFTENYKSSGHLYFIRIPRLNEEKRNKVISKFGDAGISVNVHYKPLPMMTAYNNLGFDIKNFPNAYKMYEGEITLPLHTLLTDDNVDYICRIGKKIIEEI